MAGVIRDVVEVVIASGIRRIADALNAAADRFDPIERPSDPALLQSPMTPESVAMLAHAPAVRREPEPEPEPLAGSARARYAAAAKRSSN